ncbi:bifunctional riboflavin kinase/FAD synthetase [Mycetocola reblochoni]|uniref:Riboflavin biosynthesis protein n=2 Tax=Mycetocola reblochoni TaxID=331618 RepID=A0A1R4JU86_9MICO|nr:bifunctional riboflavin kinase/FAD synthetase [Mycetocola reblochoni]RLP70360.1 bifunctional riboflavin kinase/FAD synthetase [Mycetocola reblochoni]SJN35597.1 Riboflavin kinase / FMN adenylyltransferase [Mycetocola reblochoni REB411]
MISAKGVAGIPQDFGPSAVTIGKFDGVHAGHRAVITDLIERSRAEGLSSVVVTFDRNPLAVINPEACPEPLLGEERKAELLAASGVDATLTLPFDEELSRLSPEDFVRTILHDALHARLVIVGEDFRFGHRGAGDAAALTRLGERYGFDVDVVADVHPNGDRRASSSWIRELLGRGEVAAAAALLNHAPTVRGEVVHGAKRGRELGFPTANLTPDADGYIPADGVYAGWLVADGVRMPAAVSVGNNPTFDGVPQKQVEAYVLDQTDLDLYGLTVDVEFVDRIRGMVAFTGIEPLIVQMRDDVERVRRLLS